MVRKGKGIENADSALNTVGNTLLVASAVALIFDPEPFSKAGVGVGGGVLGLSAKGVRYAIVGVKLGLDFFKGSRWVYSGYRTATTAQTVLKAMKWGNNRIQKNQYGNEVQGTSQEVNKNLFSSKTDKYVTRITRAGDKDIRIAKEDGNILDISPYRFKEYIPN